MKVKVLKTGEIWNVWSDNTEERTYSCLPEDIGMPSSFINDESCSWLSYLEDFYYDDVEEFGSEDGLEGIDRENICQDDRL